MVFLEGRDRDRSKLVHRLTLSVIGISKGNITESIYFCCLWGPGIGLIFVTFIDLIVLFLLHFTILTLLVSIVYQKRYVWGEGQRDWQGWEERCIKQTPFCDYTRFGDNTRSLKIKSLINTIFFKYLSSNLEDYLSYLPSQVGQLLHAYNAGLIVEKTSLVGLDIHGDRRPLQIFHNLGRSTGSKRSMPSFVPSSWTAFSVPPIGTSLSRSA